MDSTDEEIIEILLPIEDLRRENRELRTEIERLRAALADVFAADPLSYRAKEIARRALGRAKCR